MVDVKKEQEPIHQGGERATEQPRVEAPKQPEAQPEVESVVEKIEKRAARITGKQGQQDEVVIEQPQAQQPPITLPVTQAQMTQGKRGSVEFSLTWLVAWAVRQIKILSKIGRKVYLKQEDAKH